MKTHAWMLAAALLWFGPAAPAAERPNIVLIYADDLGYADTSAYGATAVKTPHVDRLAREGLRFLNGYATSATCTPSRYSMLTGEYAFRQRGTGVLPGDAALIIEPGRPTLASVLRQAGYRTGVVGKWHLGLGVRNEIVDWNQPVKPGPAEIGFDHSFIMAATGDRVPCVYLENQRVVGLDPADPIRVDYKNPFPGEPTGVSERDQLKMNWSHGHNMAVVNGIGRIGYMTGGKSALWKDEDMADVFTRKGIEFIKANRRQPFFLYFATHDIHVPRVPHPRFVGQTAMGPRGDVIAQFDACVGQLLDTLDQLGLATNTLVVLTSDNGPVIDDGYQDGAVEKLGSHRPAGPLRGGKYSIFEGGTRVPLIARWPARIKPGVSEALISQVDFPASFAALASTNSTVPWHDSQNQLATLLGNARTGRDAVVLHAGTVAIREGDWKFIPARTGPRRSQATNTELGNDSNDQLYNLRADPGEKSNLSGQNPAEAQRLSQKLNVLRNSSNPPP